MTNPIEAKYFDGQSSASQQATIVFHEAMNEFHLQTADGILTVWFLDDLEFEQYGSLLEIRNKNHPGALVKIENVAFSQKFHKIIKQNKRLDVHSRLLNLGLAKITAIAFCLLGLIVLAYFYILPIVAEKSVVLLPESFDNEMGDIFMDAFLHENDIDSAKTKYLEQFASELDLKNGKELRFAVVKSKEVNAYALPNGQIVVFSGILKNMESADQLAALLGHEASHINHRHSTKILSRNLAGYMVISLLFSDVNGIMAVLADNALQLHSLSYSRRYEQEADEQGLKTLMDNNLNPNGMVKLFEQLEKESTFSIPKILSSHPLTNERKENMQKIISQTTYQIKTNDKLDTIFENIVN